ncbi:MAG TPA: hypothetical protein VFP80_12710 [Thermoanaerobaculia bacterium]|nr:hypothetical protein [Thermoanaerobaculia bacterium]
MRRHLIATAWVAGATVPLLMATVFVVGCCVLPFHSVVHKVMPFCDMAVTVMGGSMAAHEHGHDATPAPAREKQEPVKRLAMELSATFRLDAATGAVRAAAPTPSAGYRSFISLGAVRCDRDVGLHVLVETFLI